MTLSNEGNIGESFMDGLERQIQQVIANMEFAQNLREVPRDLDLYDAGMSSHASVKLMLSVEDLFDLEFPDEMLERETFASVSSIAGSVARVLERV